jgi:ABC-type microcin C transport system permease subunit YejE
MISGSWDWRACPCQVLVLVLSSTLSPGFRVFVFIVVLFCFPSLLVLVFSCFCRVGFFLLLISIVCMGLRIVRILYFRRSCSILVFSIVLCRILVLGLVVVSCKFRIEEYKSVWSFWFL